MNANRAALGTVSSPSCIDSYLVGFFQVDCAGEIASDSFIRFAGEVNAGQAI
jgi:hypothetical protein